MAFSNSTIHAPMTAYQIEIMSEALEVYRSAGGYSKDVEYLVEQLQLYRTMLLLKQNFGPVSEPSISPVRE
jgi:hypothetical protein